MERSPNTQGEKGSGSLRNCQSPLLCLTLEKNGAEVVSEEVYPDHHSYTSEDVVSITQKAKGTEWIVTTEKDMVKLENFDLFHIPIRALRVEFKIWEEEEFFGKVMELFLNKEDRH